MKYVSIAGMIFALTLVMCVAPAQAAEPSKATQNTFERLMGERDQLVRELHDLDVEAATKMKQGEDPVETYAKQVAAQDKLDLIRTRLEMMGARYGLTVTPEPTPEELAMKEEVVTVDNTTAVANQAFARGRERAVRELQRETKQMLASLDLEAIANE